MDFKVKCVRYVRDSNRRFTVGKVYSVINGKLIDDCNSTFEAWSASRNGNSDFEALKKWFAPYYEFELVEDKKVFTKSDLKNGDVIVRENGWVEIVIVDLDVLITENKGWNNLACVNEDLTDSDSEGGFEYDIVKVYRPSKKWQCCFNESSYTAGELVYDRERDTKPKKPLYNGKVVCVDLEFKNSTLYTVGKIYQFKDGQLTADNGKTYPESSIGNNCDAKIYTFNDWDKWSTSKFIEIKE